jgi:hypothetical protein
VISINVRHCALNLMMGEQQPYDLRLSIAQRMMEAAVDILNAPEQIEDIIGPLTQIYEESYDIIAPDDVILDMVKQLRTRAENLGWDSRLKVKVQFKTIGKAFCIAIVRMDLDATFIERERLVRRDERRKPPTATVVNDNPSSDDINEFLNVVDRESSRKSHLRAVKSARRA